MQVAPDTFDNPSFKDGAVELNSDDVHGAKRQEAEVNGKENGLPPYEACAVDTLPPYNGKEAKDGETSENKDGGEDKEEKKEEQKLVGVGELFRYATGVDYVLMIGGTVCALAHGACLPALLLVFGEMTDLFIDADGNNHLNRTYLEESGCNWTQFGYDWDDIELPGGDFDKLERVLEDCGLADDLLTELTDKMVEYALYYIYVACGVLVCGYAQVAFWLMAAYRQAQKIRVTLFRSIMRQEIGWFDTHDAGELNTRLVDDVNKIQEGMGDKLGNFFQWFSSFLTGFIIGFIYGWKLTLVILAVSPLLVACGIIFSKMSALATEGALAAYAKAGSVATEVLSSIRTVFAFGGQEKEAERYKVRLYDAQTYGIKKSVYSGGAMAFMWFIIYAVYALAFWYGAKLTRQEDYTGGDVLVVFFSVLIGAFALGNAGPNLENLGTARGAAYFLFDLIDRQSLIDSSSEEGITPKDLVGNITIKDVKFKYPARTEVQVLNGLSLEVKNGQTAALVGHSGCGKSTVVQLLQRFYDVDGGSVQIDGRDVRDYNIKWLRRHLGVVSQEPVLFDTTIKENIMFGREDVTFDEVVKATKESNAFDFIQKLPQKFETLVGERGAQLSGGQKQRIAIARALVRDPKILLLDEATSALDTESEATVQAALDHARLGRTTIVVAHRLSTIKNADIIYGFQDGAVAESGSHEQLMLLGENGIYHKLVTNQKTMDPVQAEIEHELAHDKDTSHHAAHDVNSPDKRHRALSESEGKETADGEDENIPSVSMARVFRLNAPEWLYMVVGCFCSLVNGATQPAFAIIFAEVIGVFAKDKDEQKEEALFWSMMFLVIGGAAGLAMATQAYAFGVSGERLTLRLRDMVFRAYLRQEVAYFDDHKNSTGALCTRLSTDAAAVHGATGARVGTMIMSVAALGTGIVIGFVYSWKLTLLVVGFMPLIAIAGVIEMKILQGTANSGKSALEEAGKTVMEVISNIRTVAALTKEDHFYAQYVKQTSGPLRNSLRKSHAVGLMFSVSQSLIYFAYAAIFYLGAWLVENDGLDFVDMFKVFGAIVFGAMAVGQMSHFAPDAGKATVAANRLFFLLDRKPAIDQSDPSGQKPSSMKGVIHFNDVKFRYPTRPEVEVLKGLNLDILPGQSVALVGPSGCGKSTTVSLLERFYDIEGGSIKLDGVEATSLNIQWLRSQMAIVQQEPILFDTSIRENIAYGALGDASMNDVIQAARDANIHEFISSLPDGYETNVGDKGTQLSGGQKQRIAIARALVRDPKILLLDEATSALDTESEKVVQEALEKAQKGRTSIVIAHRLSTIQNSDCIFVIRNGVVHEKGTHSDLLSKKGVYYKLNVAQQKKRR